MRKILLQINFDCGDSEFESQLRKFYFCTDIGLYKILLSFYHCFLNFVYLFGGLQCFWNAFANRHQLRITSLILTFRAHRRVHVNQCYPVTCWPLLSPATPFNYHSKPFTLHPPLAFVSFCDIGPHCLKKWGRSGSLEHLYLASCIYFIFSKIIAGIFLSYHIIT